jgi:hypothetical protein
VAYAAQEIALIFYSVEVELGIEEGEIRQGILLLQRVVCFVLHADRELNGDI